MRNRHVLAERLGRLAARLRLVELVGDVGDDQRADAGAGRVRTGLAGRQVAAVAVALRRAQRRLDHQQVGAGGELDERVARPGVGAEDEAAAARSRGDRDSEALHEVVDLAEADAQRPDLELGVVLVLAEIEGLLDEVVVAPGPDDPPEDLAGAGRRWSTGRTPWSLRGP